MTMTTEELVARRVHLKEQADRISDELKQIDEKLRATFNFGNNPAGDWTVQLQHNKTLDKERFMQRFPVAQYPHFYQPTVAITEAKKFIPQVELDAFYNEGAAKIAVK
ncbi:hypothetical protein [Streptomyces sp. AC495_CC817]|uniref:hypothetical protein n=1 Tax=Streptomyces sp. AC495_CC817 TaxID=2823900 RepID=UPI001C255483|nr:hypothetical protein [Streptomyces sp. AC495_CC817]